MWKELISEITQECEFFAPTTSEAISVVEGDLQLQIPPTLKSLLRETNGVYWKHAYLHVVWSIEQIGKENAAIRRDTERSDMYMSFESLLFFAGAGVDGILFAFQVTATGVVREDNVVAWYPVEDSRPVIAFSLKDYLTRWMDGSLSV